MSNAGVSSIGESGIMTTNRVANVLSISRMIVLIAVGLAFLSLVRLTSVTVPTASAQEVCPWDDADGEVCSGCQRVHDE